MKQFSDLDWTILICVFFLCAVGAAIIGSVAPTLFWQQVLFYLVGLGLLLLFSRLDFRIYASLAKVSYLVSLGLLFLTLLAGLESRGSVRWISVGAWRLQFSELLKPVLVSVLATLLVAKPKGFLAFLKTIILIMIPVFLVFKQPDLGSAVVYFLSFLAMIFASGITLTYLLALMAVVVVILPVGWHFLADYQKQRLLGFFNPSFDPLGASYNAIQAVIAVGSGMFWGQGLGRGTQSHLLFLPEHHTDFVFASLAEEFGFMGAAFVLAIYFLLLWRIFSICLKIEDRMGMVLGTGLATILAAQVLINVGMNLGLFPVTGITLPLISYGGSSVLATMVSIGIIENIASLSKSPDSHIID